MGARRLSSKIWETACFRACTQRKCASTRTYRPGETTALTIVASPRALGMIRPDYSDAVRKAVQSEVGKDLVKMPVHQIEEQLLA